MDERCLDTSSDQALLEEEGVVVVGDEPVVERTEGIEVGDQGAGASLKIEQVIKPLLPMFIIMFVVLMLVTYIPSLSLWLPGILMK